MIRINLLPVRAAQKKEQLRGQVVLAIVGIAVTFVLCSVFYGALLRQVDNEKAELAKKQAEINQLKKAIGEVAQFKKLQAELRGKLDILEKLKEGKSGPVHLLDELSRVLPEKLWVTSFKEVSGAVKITGIGLNEEAVAQFLRDLETSPYYSGVDLKIVEQSTQGEVKVNKFEVSCTVESPAKNSSVKGGK